VSIFIVGLSKIYCAQRMFSPSSAAEHSHRNDEKTLISLNVPGAGLRYSIGHYCGISWDDRAKESYG